MKDGQIAGYFDTKYMTILRIERILHNFKDQNIIYITRDQLEPRN